MWSAWETPALEKAGPGEARGVLIYFGEAPPGALEAPISLPFTETARTAQWDVLRINWSGEVDPDSPDADALMRLAATEIGHARQEGYSPIVLGGQGLGAWLAISTAAAVSVDGLLALGPGTIRIADGRALESQPGALAARFERQRDNLADMLSKTRAKRVAVVLFEGDPSENVRGGRATAFRRALLQSAASFILIDRQSDLHIEAAIALGRFTRRYRDCLVRLIVTPITSAGEDKCDLSKGYADGSDIRFPDARPLVRLPVFSDPALAPFLGRWQGDDSRGAYVIIQSIDVGQDSVTFLHGYSPRPERSTILPWTDELRFRLEPGGRRLVHAFQNAEGLVSSHSPNELEYVLSYGESMVQEKFLLKKQRNQ